MITVLYVVAALAFLLLVFGLSRKTGTHEPDDCMPANHSAQSIGNGRLLDLSERIFDPSDARWLEEELAFPKLAEALVIERKRLAIRWLEALQASFNEVVRTPDLSSNEAPEASPDGGWKTLWLTVRFQILVSYALFVVKLFGPYHRLIPSFSWVPIHREGDPSFRRAALAQGRSSQ